MPKPEIHYSHSFGMGFWIAEDGLLMSCPACLLYTSDAADE